MGRSVESPWEHDSKIMGHIPNLEILLDWSNTKTCRVVNLDTTRHGAWWTRQNHRSSAAWTGPLPHLAFDLKNELYGIWPIPSSVGSHGALTRMDGELCKILLQIQDGEPMLNKCSWNIQMILKYNSSYIWSCGGNSDMP